MRSPYHDKIVGITTAELHKPDRLGQGFLCFELHVQTLSEVRLGTHSLENEDTESHDSLFRRLSPVFHSIEDAQNQKVM